MKGSGFSFVSFGVPARPLILGAVVAGILSGCGSNPHIDPARLERIVTTLSADEMWGRGAFSVGGERAAEFLTEEFESIGLETWDGLEGYRQTFPVYSYDVERVRVSLNGEEVGPDRVAAAVYQDSVRWRTGDAQVSWVGPDGNLLSAFRAARRASGPRLLLVHRAHESRLARLRGFLSRSSRTLDSGSGGALVLVMTTDSTRASYEVEIVGSPEEQRISNVIGVVPGRRTDELVIFSAHYDHIGIQPPLEGDSIGNGANDNATGTAAVVELARYFKDRGEPERTLVFVAFTAEEGGGYGSQYLARQIDPDRVVAMLNLEMIGKPGPEGPGAVWITGFDRSNLGSLLQGAVGGTEHVFHADPYPDEGLFFRSDNIRFARLGVPAHSLSTTALASDPDYHRVTDEVVTLDFDNLTRAVRAVSVAVVPLVEGQVTPTRIDPAEVGNR